MNTNIIYHDDLEKVEVYIDNIKNKSKQIARILSQAEEIGEIILVGGAIRDIALKNKTPRDIDIIVDTDNEMELRNIINESLTCKKNRFGGYKIKDNDVELDIWNIKDHWAFKNGIIKSVNKKTLNETTFLNFDALFYNLSTKREEMSVFNNCMQKKLLEITLRNEYIFLNPTPEINIIRMLIIQKDWNLDFSEKCIHYIKKWINDHKNEEFCEILYNYQFKHYNTEIITEKEICKYIKNL